MFTLLFGSALVAGSAGIFRRLMPRNGVPHRLAVMPYMQACIPIGLTSAFIIGAGLVITGLVSLNPF